MHRWEWAVYPEYLPGNLCDMILAAGLTIPPQAGAVGSGNGHAVNKKIRTSDVRFINNATGWQWLFDCLWKKALEANQNFGFDLTSLGYLQLAEYRAANKGHYHRHQDIFWSTEQQTDRKLSCVVQLSDPADYEGGELELETHAATVTEDVRKRGTVIFFPSMTYHLAKPVTKGIRHSIAAWFEGPRLR